MDELARLRFARKAQDVFGDEEAAYLMDHLPYGGVADIATNTGIGHLRSDMVSEFAAVRSEMRELRSDLRAEFHSELRRFTVMNVSLMTGLISAMGTVLGILIVAVN